MNTHAEERERILQSNKIQIIESIFGREAWLPMYKYVRDTRECIANFCALIPGQKTEEVMEDYSWDLHVGDGGPAVFTHFDDGPRDVYYRYGNDSGIEPLVLHRSFHGIKDPYTEISEEFRMYFNLYEDKKNGSLIRVMDSGDEEEVVRCKDGELQMRRREVKEYLSVKQMHLALYFDFTCYSHYTLADLGLQEIERPYRAPGLKYVFSASDARLPLSGGRRTISRIIGKKLIPPGSTQEEQFSARSSVEYGAMEFIIGVDEEGEPILYTSDPSKLSNHFGANPGAPDYLTPVFFKREVLGKYYTQHPKYAVEDGLLRCSGLWGLRIDNNHPKYVVVHLGDLGRDLPPSEQSYWRSFNVPPDGGFSEVAWRRGFLAQWTDSQSEDLSLKALFNKLQETWLRNFGWSLFRPLSVDDSHNMAGLRIPLSESQAEFDAQVLALAKILVDSLNEDGLARSGIEVSKEMRGIGKLAAFLELKDFPQRQQLVQYLRDLYSLRSSGSGHRKGSNYAKASEKFALSEKGLAGGFKDILKQAVDIFTELLDWVAHLDQNPEEDSPRGN